MQWRSLIFLLFFPTWLNAQEAGLTFHHLNEKDGLSDNLVNAFLKDSRGLIWIGTKNGLNRFDGVHFYIFRKSKQPNSINDNTILDLCEDQQGCIWGGTNRGVFRYDPALNRFRNFDFGNTGVAIHNILCDRAGQIWAAGGRKIWQFDKAKEIFVELPPFTQNDSVMQYTLRKNSILADPTGKGIWCAGRTGIFFYNTNSKTYLSNQSNPDSGLFNGHSYAALANSKSGLCWVFDNTDKQLVAFQPATQKVVRRISNKRFNDNTFATMIFEDVEGRIWIGTWFDGIIVIDGKTGVEAFSVKHQENEVLSVSSNYLWDAYQDADATIWLGTNGGISRCNPSKLMYMVYPFHRVYSGTDSAIIHMVAEHPIDHSWWINFDFGESVHYSNNKVIRFQPAEKTSVLFDIDAAPKNSRNAKSNGIYRIVFWKDSTFFCSGNGTWMVSSKQPKPIPYEPLLKYGYDYTISTVVFLNDSVCCFSNGKSLLKWNRRSGFINEIRASAEQWKSAKPTRFELIKQQAGGVLWFVAGSGFLGSLDASDQLKFWKIGIAENRADFSDMEFDRKGNIWLSNPGSGMLSFNPTTQETKTYFQTDGLFTDDLHSVIPDFNGNVWGLSFNKFSVFTPLYNSFSNFKVPVSENSYNYNNISTLLASGNILSCMNQYLVEFLPDRIYGKPATPKPMISVIVINGRDSLISPQHQQPIQLKSDEKSLVFKLGLLTDGSVFPYHFEYQLMGVDDSFNIAGNSAEAVYNNLPSGKYTFKLVAVANNKSWRSVETVLLVEIYRPFYLTIWFAILLFLAVVGTAFALYRRRVNEQEKLLQLERKAQLLEKEKALVMYENLKQHLNPHFLFNSLTSLSSLIRIDGKMAVNFLDKMSKVYRYILKNRDQEVVPLREEIKFVELYNDLQTTRFASALQINLNIDEAYYDRKIAPVTLQNLVENAIKHNTADASAPLIIELFVEDDFLVVRNNLQKKNFVETSNRQGLKNMESLYQYLSPRPMIIEETEHFFVVQIPLI